MSTRSENSPQPVDDFLGILAHELRNPLAPLRNGLQIIRMSKNDPQAVDRTLDIMERQLQQVVRIIDELMEANRISRGKIELNRETVGLETVVQSAIDAKRGRIDEARHRLTMAKPSEEVFVHGDFKRLTQIFVHLIDNAVKYSGKDGLIEVSIHREDGGLGCVVVTDHGQGISPDKLLHVFDLFAKADHSLERGQDGLGVGLSIVKGLVEMHGGTVEAQSRGPGAGSSFSVRLPICDAPQTKDEEGEESDEKIGDFRVLIVDDNPDVAQSLAMMLKIKGLQPKVAYDGVEALRAAAAYRPEIVLLDIGMPKLNGFDVCRVIREQPWGKDMMVVALTGWGDDEDSVKSREAGFNYHLVKPVDMTALERIVSEVRPAAA